MLTGAEGASPPEVRHAPDFGPNVKIFDPSMSKSEIKAAVDAIAARHAATI